MRVCPSCGNTYPDDANFCPMDATRLPAAPAAAAPSPAVTMQDHPAPIAGRFAMSGSGAPTPTGTAGDATDLQANGATVTLKLVPPEVLPTSTMSDRALRELKQLAKVTSDRIVRVIDQGRLPDGRIYVATEHVDGAATLEELVGREGPLPLERAKSIVLQVGEALTEAQKVGVIHRDVAPRNILVGPGDRVKLADFGLAEPVPGTNDRVFGAPAFISPEQAEGKPVDQRSNIYSLGAVYYFALTGQPPFAGDASSLMQQHLSSPPPPPSTKRPGLGSEIDRVILKALEKSGGRRHLTLRQLLTEVSAAQSQAVRAGADARTVMDMQAPVIPPPAAQPQAPSRHDVGAQTVMGMPSPMAPPSRPAPQPQPSAPQAPPQAPTVMAEAPPRPAPVAPQAPAQAPTMMAEAPRPAPVAAPPPVAAAAPPAAQKNNSTGKKGAFRETAWFKRGEIEEEMMKAQAAAGDNPLKSGTTGQHPVPQDESQVDLSAQDRARLSLKTGATQAMPVVRNPQAALPGERMDEQEMLAEINPGRKYLLIAGVALVVVVLGIVIYFATRSAPKAEAPPPTKPAPVAAAPPATAPTPTPPAAPAPTPPTPTPPTPKPPTPAPTASDYVAAVDKLESAPTVDKRELKRLERVVTAEMKAAHRKKDRALEASDRTLLARLKKLAKKK